MPLGIWDDNIILSTKNVDFLSSADSIVITTEGDGWWIDGISFQDNRYSYYDSSDVNMELESYSIIEDCFKVERRDKNTLFVKLEDNVSGSERVMTITLEAGDYFDYVNIIQASN